MNIVRKRSAVGRGLGAVAVCLTVVGIAVAQEGADKKEGAPQAAKHGGPPPSGPIWNVRTDAVRQERLEQRREVTGEIRASRRATLAAQRGGLVVEVLVEAGDVVKAGDVLARLDSRRTKLQIRRAEAEIGSRTAEVAARQSDADKATRDDKKMEDSFARGAATETEREDMKSALAGAKARLDEAAADLEIARAALELLKADLDDMTVEAPFGGRVIAKLTEVGQWVREGDAVADVAALDRLDVWLDVPEAFVGRLSAVEGGEPGGPLVRVRLKATERVIESRISGIVPSADLMSRLFPVRISVDNSRGELQPGMSVVGLVPTGATEDGLTVHKDAVLRGSTGTYVYVDAGGTAQIAPVEILFGVADRVAVRSTALRPGMMVVVEGNERLYPGANIKAGGTADEGTAGSR